MTARRQAKAALGALRAVGALIVGAFATVLMIPASAAFARDDGELPGEPMSAVETLLVYVAVPAGLFLLISVLVLAPSMSRAPRYRPSVGWWAAPIWFNGPEGVDNPEAAVRAATPTTDGGGASARW